MTSSSEARRSTVLLRGSTGGAGVARLARFSSPLHPQGSGYAGEGAFGAERGVPRSPSWDAGHDEGYAAGLAEAERERAAWAEAAAEAERRDRAERSARWETLLGSLRDALDGAAQSAAVADLHRTATHMAVEIAEALVGHHLEVDGCAARDAVARALGDVPRGAEVTLRLNPADADLAPESLEEIAPGIALTVVADATVEVGGCVADLGDRTVDAQVGAALERVRKVLAR
jgi:flagellar assembly protein FliH